MIVVKRNGRKEPFDREKMAAAIGRAGAPGKHAKKISREVEKSLKSESVKSSDLRLKVISLLHSHDATLACEFANFKKAIRNMSSSEEFMENRLSGIVGKGGRISPVYGGFHILVTNEGEFDFPGVLRELLSSRQSVAIEKREGKLLLVSK